MANVYIVENTLKPITPGRQVGRVHTFTSTRKLGEFVAYIARDYPEELPGLKLSVDDQAPAEVTSC